MFKRNASTQAKDDALYARDAAERAATGQEPPAAETHSRRGKGFVFFFVPVGAIVAVIGAVAGTSHNGTHVQHAAVSHTAPAASQAAPAAAPSPDGTFTGSCDYTIDTSGDSYGGTAIGEVDVQNTGNVGTDSRVTISWPQEGYAPLRETKHVRLAPGDSRAVRFHLPITLNQVTMLQSWQESHGLADGCHYHSTITGTFGA